MADEGLLLTPYELSQLKGNEWSNGRWYYDPYEIMRKQIAKIKEAGYKSPEQVWDLTMGAKKSGWDDCEKWYTANHYVRLADDQSLPQAPIELIDEMVKQKLFRSPYTLAQHDMLRAIFRKVILEE